MSTTIDSLSIQIKSSASSAVKSIDRLAEALGRLQKNSELTKTINNLKELDAALEKLGGSSGSVTKIKRLSTGLNTTTESTKNLTRANKDLNNTLSSGSIGLFATIQNYESLYHVLNSVATAMANVISQAMEWDGIEARFGRVFGEDAEETYNHLQKINDAMGLNVQEMMQYSSMYGSLLSGFGLGQDKVTAISVGLTELTYDLWAANNDVVKRYEDVATAVKSAITGEIEPIRNLGIAMTEASLQEFIDSTHLAGMSIEKMTEAQKSEIRYAAMVNSALNQGIIGTYAREMNTAEGAVRSLSQSFKGLVQALGSLFIPMLQTVVPYITAFVELLTDAVFWLAELVGIPIQRIDFSDSGVKDMASGAKEAKKGLNGASKAAKKLRDYTMGFDELNVIDPDSGSGAAGGDAGADDVGWGTGLDLDTLWDDAVFAQAKNQVNELKEKIREYIDEHKVLLSVVGGVTAFLGFMKVLRGLNALLGITKTIDNLKTAFGGLKTATTGIKEFFKAAKQMSSEVGWLNALFPKTSSILSSASAWVTSTFVPAMTNILSKIPTVLSTVLRALPWVAAITAIVGAIALAIVDYDFTDIGYKLGHALGTAFKKVGEWVGKAKAWMVELGVNILAGVGKAWKWVKDEFDIDNVFELILLMFNPKAWLTEILPKLLEIGKEVLPGLWEGIKSVWDNFWGNIEELIDGFVKGFKDALGIASPSKVFADIGKWLVQGLLNGITDKWKAVKDWFNKTVAPKFTKDYWMGKFETIRSAIATKLGEVKDVAQEKWAAVKKWFEAYVSPKFTKDYWVSKFSGLKDGFTSTIKNAVNSGIDLMNRFIGWINKSLSFSWDGLEIAGKEVYPGGSIQLFTIPTIPKFANGGFIEDGLFTMNRGEIAGKFSNGKSVVANNEQIIAGIAEGVYSAVVAAMNETQRGGDQNVNVYLDGKQIYASIKKTESQRGVALMGNQLGYSY